MCESCTACCIHEYAGQQRLRTWLLMLQEMDILDMPVTEADIDSTAARDDGAVAATATSGESHSATAMEPSNCYRCLMPNYMGSHADECEAPLQKFLVCPKCQCICATLAVFDRHTRVCLGLTVKRRLPSARHIVRFESPPQLGPCEHCGVYRQRKGALLDAHRYVCHQFSQEQNDDRCSLLPADFMLVRDGDTLAPPQYFTRLLTRMRERGTWALVEAESLAQTGIAENWSQVTLTKAMYAGRIPDIATSRVFLCRKSQRTLETCTRI